MRASKKGIVSKIKVIKFEPKMLVRFSLVVDDESLNCIVVNPELVHKILMMPEGLENVSVFGHYNKRKQLVVDKLATQYNASPNYYDYRKRA